MPPLITGQPGSSQGQTPWIQLGSSTCFIEVRYFRKSRVIIQQPVLQVRFRKYGEVWEYVGVSETTWRSLLSADSRGAYYNYFIKGRYPSRPRGFLT